MSRGGPGHKDNNTDPSCSRELWRAFRCYVTLWNACAEDPALSGLGWRYARFIDYMFLRTVRHVCTSDTFTTTTTTTTTTLPTTAAAPG